MDVQKEDDTEPHTINKIEKNFNNTYSANS